MLIQTFQKSTFLNCQNIVCNYRNDVAQKKGEEEHGDNDEEKKKSRRTKCTLRTRQYPSPPSDNKYRPDTAAGPRWNRDMLRSNSAISALWMQVATWVERFDRRGIEPFELFTSEFGPNSLRIEEMLLEFIRNPKISGTFNIFQKYLAKFREIFINI